ncbi:hypothetical protein FRB90_003701, partial [Tulasnella sp. 427]
MSNLDLIRMPLSGRQLAEILRSFGASEVDIATAASELSQAINNSSVNTESPVTASSQAMLPEPLGIDNPPSSQHVRHAPPASSHPRVPPAPAASSHQANSVPLAIPSETIPNLNMATMSERTFGSLVLPSSTHLLTPAGAEYFETSASAGTTQPTHPRLASLQHLALLTAASGVNTSPMTGASGQNASSPWSIPPSRTSQWGVSGVTRPHPSAIPSALGPALAGLLPSSVLPLQTNTGSLITSSTPVPKLTRRKASSSTSKSTTVRKLVHRKTIYLIPRASATRLTSKIKAACDYAGLTASPDLFEDMTTAQIRDTLRGCFERDIDWTVHSYELFHMTRELGPVLCPMRPPNPSGHELRTSYQKKQVLVMRLICDAEVPDYAKGIKLYEDRHPRGSRRQDDDDEEEEEELEDEEDEDDEALVTCDWCEGLFDVEKLEIHRSRCPARRKRTLSPANSSRRPSHSRHQSAPAIFSPERKRPRRDKPREASSDGEADTRLAGGSKNALDEDIDELDDEDIDELDEAEQAELDADPEADEEEVEEIAVPQRSKGGSVALKVLCTLCDDILPSKVDAKYWEQHVVLLKRVSITKEVVKRTLPVASLPDILMPLILLQSPLASTANSVQLRRLSTSPSFLSLLNSFDTESGLLSRYRNGWQPLMLHMLASYGMILEFLFENLPPDSFFPSSVLRTADFLSFMLAPYAAALLIAEDMPSLSMAE